MMEKQGRFKILNMDWPYFCVLAIIVLLAMKFNFLPKSLAGQIPLLLVFGETLNLVGKKTPIVKDYLGGGSVVILFGCAALVMVGFIPANIAKETKTFMTRDFINYALAALCCGSIFGMSRKVLVKAALRYIPCIIGGVIGAGLLAALVGALLYTGAIDTILFIALPIMGGGTSAGAVPMSQMFASVLHKDPGQMLAIMTPAVALGNACAIVMAGILDKIGKAYPTLTGNGQMMRIQGEDVKDDLTDEESVTNLSVFATGMAIAGVFLGIGQLIQKQIFPGIHAYAWMILLMIIVKIAGIMPSDIEKCCALWYKFFIKNFATVLLAGLGIGLIDLKAVLPALTPVYILIVFATVLGAVIGSAAMGYLVGFYPIEAAITGGLCMANMGGSGDIATLGAAKRMELMPFAAVSSRLGGAMILILGSILLAMLK